MGELWGAYGGVHAVSNEESWVSGEDSQRSLMGSVG